MGNAHTKQIQVRATQKSTTTRKRPLSGDVAKTTRAAAKRRTQPKTSVRHRKKRKSVALSPIPPRKESIANDSEKAAKAATRNATKQKKALTFEEAMKKRAPTYMHVLHHTFHLLDVEQSGVITLSNLEKFLSKYGGNEKFDYHEIREMLHRATNSYEMTFEDFRRIMEMDDEEFKTKVKSVDCMSTLLDTAEGSLSNDLWPSSDSSDSWPIDSTRRGSISADSLDLREEMDQRKHQFGIFNKKQHASAARIYKGSEKDLSMWTGGGSFLAVPPNSLFKRVKSTDMQHHSKMERDYFRMEQVFQIMDSSRKGHLSAKDILSAMQEVGTTTSNSLSEVATLLRLIGKKSLDETVTPDEFVQLYAKCCKTKTAKKKNGSLTPKRKVHPAPAKNVTPVYKKDLVQNGPSPKIRMRDA